MSLPSTMEPCDTVCSEQPGGNLITYVRSSTSANPLQLRHRRSLSESTVAAPTYQITHDTLHAANSAKIAAARCFNALNGEILADPHPCLRQASRRSQRMSRIASCTHRRRRSGRNRAPPLQKKGERRRSARAQPRLPSPPLNCRRGAAEHRSAHRHIHATDAPPSIEH